MHYCNPHHLFQPYLVHYENCLMLVFLKLEWVENQWFTIGMLGKASILLAFSLCEKLFFIKNQLVLANILHCLVWEMHVWSMLSFLLKSKYIYLIYDKCAFVSWLYFLMNQINVGWKYSKANKKYSLNSTLTLYHAY